MNLRSSFIFSSEKPVSFAQCAKGAFWVVLWLVIIDLAINTAFRYPSDPKEISPRYLNQYFEFGRSTEGKLRRMIRPAAQQSAPIALAGWYDPLAVGKFGNATAAKTITIYGMSHANLLAQAIGRVSEEWNSRSVTAPGATTNWAYGAYLRDARPQQARVAVLAFMSANLAMITTTTPLTWNTDSPAPYTADRVAVTEDGDHIIRPPHDSFAAFADSFQSNEKWKGYREFLSQYDTFYDPLLFDQTILDHSALARLVRRAYAQRIAARARLNSLHRNGFDPASEEVQAARAIIRKFVHSAEDKGDIPVVYIVNNYGYSNHLYRALEPALKETGVSYLNSDDVVPVRNPSNYLPDSHFIPVMDEKMARRLIEIIEEKLRTQGPA